ncbi:TPA: hypothetical protein RKU11_000925 [Enterobacter asburiae]|uniref:hypothetical protein n=1 Tax=Enterobacter asburiae TaxID=61645 RepID=UPI00157B130E|nr:hypothetical protein [Enterobacter asburiae]HDV8455669.1 hypothetical protein [Enterobacter asburiae]
MKKIALIFFWLMIAYVGSLFIVYSTPNFHVAENVADSAKVLGRDGDWPPVSQAFKTQTMLDNFTDLRVMMPRALSEGGTVVSALDMGGYPRYWHGYQVILRPLASFFSYEQIRFLYALLVFSSFGMAFYAIAKRISALHAVAFAVSMCFAHIEVFSSSMQFSNLFVITFLFISFVLLRDDVDSFIQNKLITSFFVVGSLVNFVDLLTVPIVSLGLPLLAVIFYTLRQGSVKVTPLIFIKSCFAWSVGYGATWVAKWLFASAILGKNVVKDAIEQMAVRTSSDGLQPLDRLHMLDINFLNMFLSEKAIYVLVLIFVLGILWNRRSNLTNAVMILFTALMPYAWYLVLANHSQVHFWFTYRSQAITMFAALGLLSTLRLAKK